MTYNKHVIQLKINLMNCTNNDTCKTYSLVIIDIIVTIDMTRVIPNNKHNRQYNNNRHEKCHVMHIAIYDILDIVDMRNVTHYI